MQRVLLLITIATFFVLPACKKKDKLSVTPAVGTTDPTFEGRSDISLVRFYNVEQSTDSSGNEVDVISDSSSLALINLASSNILAISTFFNAGEALVTIDGEYKYSSNGWIKEVYNPATGQVELTAAENSTNGKFKLEDKLNQFTAFYAEPMNGTVSYYAGEIKRDTLNTAAPNRKKIVVTSDSIAFEYIGQDISKFDSYHFPSDSFQVIVSGGISQPVTPRVESYWNNFLSNDQKTRQRTSLKNGVELMKSVTYSPSSVQPINPLYNILAPLNFRILDVPFIHSKFLPGSATIKNANQAAEINQFEYDQDNVGRTSEMRIFNLDNGNQKRLIRIVRFTY